MTAAATAEDDEDGDLHRCDHTAIRPNVYVPSQGKDAVGKALDGSVVIVKYHITPTGLEGEILSVSQYATTPIVGGIDGSGKTFVPSASWLPMMTVIKPFRLKIGSSDLIAVGDVSWPADKDRPTCQFLFVVGTAGEYETKLKCILLKYGISFESFPLAVDQEVVEIISSCFEMNGRRDFTADCTFSIDGTRTILRDDAVQITPLGDGLFELVVHICDVSAYVRPGSNIDKEALKRSANMYLSNLFVGMLPETIASSLSLDEGMVRPVVSTVFIVDLEGNFHGDPEIVRGKIMSKASLSYIDAQKQLDDGGRTGAVAMSLRLLRTITQNLRAKRLKAGAVIFDLPKVQIVADQWSNKHVLLAAEETLEAQILIEELMLLVNTCVARTLAAYFPTAAFLRKQPTPTELDFARLLAAAETRSVPVSTQTSASLTSCLRRAKLPEEPRFVVFLQHLALQCCRASACYAVPSVNMIHYELAETFFCQFTSPLRRYGDLVCHYQLAACLGWDTMKCDLDEPCAVQTICDAMNRMAKLRKKVKNLARNIKEPKEPKDPFLASVFIADDAYFEGMEKSGMKIFISKLYTDSILQINSAKCKMLYVDKTSTLHAGSVAIPLYSRLEVRLDMDAQKHQFHVKLIRPEVTGLSKEPCPDDYTDRPTSAAAIPAPSAADPAPSAAVIPAPSAANPVRSDAAVPAASSSRKRPQDGTTAPDPPCARSKRSKKPARCTQCNGRLTMDELTDGLCVQCDAVFCPTHRLPATHNCTGD